MRLLSLLRRGFVLPALALVLAGCALPAPDGAPRPTPETTPELAAFAEVVASARPVAGEVCREYSPHLDCDFVIVIDDRPDQPPNAFHMRDRAGRPIIGFTTALIRDLENSDEIAMVFGHEAGHHIADHIPRLQREAYRGALIGGLVARMSGLDRESARELVDASAIVRSRRYSQRFEFEADRIGALIAHRAGYDPRRGAALLRRTPDPDNLFLSTHPPSAERLREIEHTITRIESGQAL